MSGSAFHALKTLALALAVFSTGLAHAAGGHGPHWSYHGDHEGPARWAELDTTFETCAKGRNQSPVDISTTVKAELPALQFHYGQSEPTIVNNGHTVQVNVAAGSQLKVGEQTYELLQFHFHTPSEETIQGKHLPMVAHFVHKNATGQLGVVAVLFQSSPTPKNATYAPVFDHLPRPGEKITVDGLVLDLAHLLPAERGYYAFEGSLTTPPCSESVQWMVLKKPVALGHEQIKAFRRLFNANARPVQPLNGRIIKESL
ncbi:MULTISPECIES: carbonic anhydrase [Giesbergeria]|uniref:carbonic anhydrase n=1 Tax=Giesbergeria sinuosa TaxID=80883 RepID=A0ABV9QBP9_9BURK